MRTLHLGLHKTGTTSIQLALGSVSRRHVPIYVGPSSLGVDGGEGWLHRLDRALEHEDVLVSSEDILGSAFDGYLEAEQRAEQVSQCVGEREVSVIVYLRPHLNWISSVYAQAVQQGEAQPASDFVHRMLESPWIHWMNLVAMLEAKFGADQVKPRLYVPGSDVVGDFFSVAGLGRPPDFGRHQSRSNASVAAIQIPILMAAMDSDSMSSADKLALRRTFQGILSVGAPRGFSPFSTKDQLLIQETLSPDWHQVSRHLVEAGEPMGEAVQHDESGSRDVPLDSLERGLADPRVMNEAIRCISVLAVAYGGEEDHSSLLRRGWSKLLQDPGNILKAGVRVVRRGRRRRTSQRLEGERRG